MDNLENKLSRRSFLRLTVVSATATSFGLTAFGSDISKEELERFALETQRGIELGTYESGSTELSDYEYYFQFAMGKKFSYESYLNKLRKKFPNEELLVVDIGGNAGTAAKGLDNISGVSAFSIDPLPCIPEKGKELPRERYIIRKIEETGLPDSSFHFMTSHHSFHATYLPKSFPEVYRLLKYGGVALIEIEYCLLPKKLSELDAVPIKDKIEVVYQARQDPHKRRPLQDFIGVVRDYYEKNDQDKALLLNLYWDARPVFIIEKNSAP